MDDLSFLGENLKNIREEKGLNLGDVSDLTGISKAMLSKIERGESTPTITSVWKIANGLKITLNDLVTNSNAHYSVKNIEDITPIRDDDGKFTLYTLFPFSPLDGVQIFYGVFEPGYHYQPDMFIHESSTKEYCVLFKGSLDVVIEDVTYSLKEGCAIDFDSQKKHGYINTGEGPAVVCMMLV